jgi:hypothetical protein
VKRSKLAALVLVAACSSATHEPPPLESMAPDKANGRSADQLITQANTAWARRAEPGRAAAAQDLFLDAAVADPHSAAPVLGAMRVLTYRIEHEKGVDRGALSVREVELGQWCQRRAPGDAECDYRLAIALGQQARERKSTGKDAMGKMVDLLHAAIARAPEIDAGGPHRVLAMLLLRAPGWPLGPGDSQAGLEEARAAVRVGPDSAENQLALGEALVANGQSAEARAAYQRAAELATAARKSGGPEVEDWLAQARNALGKLSD